MLALLTVALLIVIVDMALCAPVTTGRSLEQVSG
jgi:hypothetical protein